MRCATGAPRRFEPGAFVVGVHYRGTDSTHKWTGRLNNYRTQPGAVRGICR